MTAARPGWRETLEADPLGLASHRQWEETPTETPSDPRGSLLRLAVIVAVVIGFGFTTGAGETVLLVLALVLCIVAHEWGHYLTAKAAGIKVTEFFFGFGPRLWSIKRGETEYGVKALPLGGYCRIVGMNNLEDVAPEDEPRTYRQAPLWRRLSVDVAGSSMHFVIAAVVLFAMFFWTGDNGNYLTSPQSLSASSPIVEIDRLTTGASPAQQAGFQLGDRIVAIDGRRFANWDAMTAFMDARPGVRLDVTVRRGGRLIHLFPTPVSRAQTSLAGPNGGALPTQGLPAGFLGISPSVVVHSGFGLSLSRAGGAWVHASALTLGAFGHLFTFHGVSSYFHMLSSQQAADNPTNSVRFESPVGVVRLLHQAGQSGLPTVLWLVAVINISVGIFNLLPLFPLDGGRVAVGIYEGIRSRRRRYHADVAKLLPVFYVGLAFIAFISVSALFLDLRDITT